MNAKKQHKKNISVIQIVSVDMVDCTVFNHDEKTGFTLLNPLMLKLLDVQVNIEPNSTIYSEELQTNNGDKWKIELFCGTSKVHCRLFYYGPRKKQKFMVKFYSIWPKISNTCIFATSTLTDIFDLHQSQSTTEVGMTVLLNGLKLSYREMGSNVTVHAKIWIKNDDYCLSSNQVHNSFLTDMQAFYSEQSNLDVCLVVEPPSEQSERIPAHKIVLIARSVVFKTLFSTEMNETSSSEIHIADFSADTVRLFVKYLYTDACDEVHLVQCGAAEELFRMAHKYEVNGLASLCEAHLASSLDVNNAADRLALAATYSLPYLREKCVRFIGSNIKEVSSTADFHAKLDSVGVDIYREIVHAIH